MIDGLWLALGNGRWKHGQAGACRAMSFVNTVTAHSVPSETLRIDQDFLGITWDKTAFDLAIDCLYYFIIVLSSLTTVRPPIVGVTSVLT